MKRIHPILIVAGAAAVFGLVNYGRALSAEREKPAAQDREKPSEMPDLKRSTAPDPAAFRAAHLYYITKSPGRGGFHLTADMGRAVYEYAGAGYDTTWSFLGQDNNFFYFKESGYQFWGAFARSASSNGMYKIWVSTDGQTWQDYAYAGVLAQRSNSACPCHAEKATSTATPAAASDKRDSPSKVFTFGRKDAGECEWRTETITIYPDGRYTDVAVMHNHSRFPDDGDNHRTQIRVMAGNDLVTSWSWERFVPRGDDRTKEYSGRSEDIRRNFQRINKIERNIECD
jgi:hypothetical protein